MLIAIALAGSQVCAAEEVHWTNPAGGNFSEGANWDLGRPPGPGDHALIDLDGTYTVNLDADVTLGGLTLGGQSGTQTLATDVARTIVLGYHPVLIGESGVLRFRGIADQLERFDNHGTMVLGSSALRGEGLIYPTLNLVNHAGATLRSEGYARLTGNLINDGLIRVNNPQPSIAAYLEASSIANSGSIEIRLGGGGLRGVFGPTENAASGVIHSDTSVRLERDLVNHGTIEVTAGELQCEELTTDGTVRLGPGVTMTVSDLTYDGGEFGGPGADIALADPGGRCSLNVDLHVVPQMSLVVNLNIGGNSAGRIYNAGHVNVTSGGTFKLTNQLGGITELRGGFCRLRDCENQAGATLRLVGIYGGDSFWVYPDGNLLNEGLVELSSEVPDAEVWLDVNNGTLSNNGRIEFLPGAGDTLYHVNANSMENDENGRIDVTADVNLSADAFVNDGVISVTEAELEMDADLIDLASLEGQLRVTDGTLRLSRGRVVLPAAKQLELIRATLAFTDTTLDLTDDTDGFDVAFLLDRTTVNGPGRLIIVGSLDAAYSTFNAPLVNRSGADTLFSGVTHIDGDVINEPGAQMAFLGTVNVDGTLTNEPGAALRIFGRDLRDASVVLHERFVNDGVVRLLSGRASLSAALTAAAGFINNGTIELAARGAATIDLPTGTLVNHGVIDILPSPGGNANPPRTIAASLHNAEGGVVSVQSNATIGLPGASLVNAGSMSVSACRLDAPGSDFENRGVFQLIDGGMYFSVGSYVQTAGQTLLAGGVLGSGTLIEGGELTGDGTVGPFLINTGRVSPGSPVGRIDVVGGYTQTPGGVLHIEIAGTDPVEFDTLAVGGGAMLDGTLEASLEGGFEPTPGDRFAFLPSSSRSGRFADVIAPCLAPRSHWQVNYNPADVTLEAAPPLAGDMNCDCALDAFDIEPFVLALFDPAGYAARHPDCDIDLADLNGDGRLDALDIEPFVALLLR